MFVCNQCSYTTSCKSNLSRHKRNKHTDKNTLSYLTCSDCDYKAVDKDAIKKHYNRKHESNPYKFFCDMCNHVSKTGNDLNRHIRDMHEEYKGQVFKCEICSYQTYRKGTIVSHMQKKHKLGEIKQRCTYENCTWSTASTEPSWLRLHITRCHQSNEAKCFECDECSYKTLTKSSLKVHKALKHNIEVHWFACNVCTYRSKTKGMLQSHIRNNHEDHTETFPCTMCNYQAKQKGNVKRHIEEVHERNKVYKCDMCDFETYYRSSIYTHQKTNHFEALLARSKQQEERIAYLLSNNGWKEWYNADLMPPIGYYKREKRIDFSCVDTSDTWCRIDFVLGKPNGYIFLEIDENQHKFGYESTLSCDMKRMAKVMTSIRIERSTTTPRIFWLRYNPHAWRVDGSLQCTYKRERELWLIQFLNELDIEDDLVIGYAYYDVSKNSLSVLENEEYHEQFAEVAVNLTEPMCQSCDVENQT